MYLQREIMFPVHCILICAPTGAGKTSIAMLTILYEMKQHISQGGLVKNALSFTDV